MLVVRLPEKAGQSVGSTDSAVPRDAQTIEGSASSADPGVCAPSGTGPGRSIGYMPSKQARHRSDSATVVASVMAPMEMYASELAPSDLPISSTVRSLAMSSSRVAKSIPKKQGHLIGGEEMRICTSAAPASRSMRTALAPHRCDR